MPPHPESHQRQRRGRGGVEHVDRVRPGPGRAGQPDRGPHPGPVHPDPPRPGGRPGALGRGTTPSWRPVVAWPTPAELKRVGRARIDARLKKHRARRHTTWAGQIVAALDRQTVVVAGTDAAGTVLPHLARQLIAPRAQRADRGASRSAAGSLHRPTRPTGRCCRPGRGPGAGPPSLPGPDHPCPGWGSRPPQCSWPKPRARPSPPAPTWPPTPV